MYIQLDRIKLQAIFSDFDSFYDFLSSSSGNRLIMSIKMAIFGQLKSPSLISRL
jgi:hypothetical protein